MTNEKLLAAAAYAFFIPALYIALTDRRKEKFLSFAAAQAILLWVLYFLIYIILRIVVNLIPAVEIITLIVKITMWGYALFLAAKALRGVSCPIPYISKLAEKIC